MSAFETTVQLVTAVATAAAAVFAALSARSSAQSAKEMEQARYLSTSPLLTVTPEAKPMSYGFDFDNQMDGPHPHSKQLRLENHGNGPALNLRIHTRIDTHEQELSSDVVVGELSGQFPSKCIASNQGIYWEGRRGQFNHTPRLEAENFIVSLSQTESEFLDISPEQMRGWVLDAIKYNAAPPFERKHVAHLTIVVTYDGMVRRAQRAEFRFLLSSTSMPELGFKATSFGGGCSYTLEIEPISA